MVDLGPLEKEKYDLVMLYSGGADSRLMLHFALELKRKPFCILIDYGQKHIKELVYAEQQLPKLGVPYQIIKIEGLNIQSGLTGDKVADKYEGVHSMNVPGRNTIFIALAYSVAESKGITEIWYGPDYSDRENRFPDCYQDYVVKMNEVLKIAGVRPLTLKAPLLGLTKEMIVSYLEQVVGVNVEKELHGGYEETGDLAFEGMDVLGDGWWN